MPFPYACALHRVLDCGLATRGGHARSTRIALAQLIAQEARCEVEPMAQFAFAGIRAEAQIGIADCLRQPEGAVDAVSVPSPFRGNPSQSEVLSHPHGTGDVMRVDENVCPGAGMSPGFDEARLLSPQVRLNGKMDYDMLGSFLTQLAEALKQTDPILLQVTTEGGLGCCSAKCSGLPIMSNIELSC